jgi:hypothetical protein
MNNSNQNFKGKLIILNNDPVETIYEGTIPVIFRVR